MHLGGDPLSGQGTINKNHLAILTVPNALGIQVHGMNIQPVARTLPAIRCHVPCTGSRCRLLLSRLQGDGGGVYRAVIDGFTHPAIVAGHGHLIAPS